MPWPVASVLRRAGVRTVLLVHGTFVGTDAGGLAREVARLWPAWGDRLQQWQKQRVDDLAGDRGNYTPEFVRLFDAALNPPDSDGRIEVQRVNWSSENHHVGRADGAVRLLDALLTRAEQLVYRPAEGAGASTLNRILLWGHSHGGNVFALVTNLLGGDREVRRSFFHAAQSYYRWPRSGAVDLPMWERVRDALEKHERPLSGLALDFVTFGTPIRYGWDSGGYDKLLHIVFHRPQPGRPPDRAAFPTSVDDIRAAVAGDYIQQLGIAGTNVAPTLWAWRAWQAEMRLSRLLQGGVSKRTLWRRWHEGVRVPDEGDVWLVDYLHPGPLTSHVAGHGLYTQCAWLPFHGELVAHALYGGEWPCGAITPRDP